MATTTSAERPPQPADQIGLGAWRALIESHARLVRELDAEMRQRHGYALGDYDVLVQLSEAPGDRLRMCDLANAVLLSPSGLSRRVDRLERGGLIKRARGASDGRNIEATLTGAGKRTLATLRRTHREGIKRRFVTQFNDEELVELGELLARLVSTAEPTAAGA